MAAEFIGSTVLVTLRSGKVKVSGIVAEIVGQQLTLRDVTWLASGVRNTLLSIEASSIIDLEVVPETIHDELHNTLQPPGTPTSLVPIDDHPPSPLPGHSLAGDTSSPAPSSFGGRHAFLDPAIVSYGRPTTKSNRLHASPSPQQFAVEAEKQGHGQDNPTAVFQPYESVSSKPMQAISNDLGMVKKIALATATLSEPFDNHSHSAKRHHTAFGQEVAELETKRDSAQQVSLEHLEASGIKKVLPIRQNGKRTRRNTKARNMKNAAVQASIPITQRAGNGTTSPFVLRKNKTSSVTYSTGQTSPIEADAVVNASPSKFGSHFLDPPDKKTSRQAFARVREAQNGWATEDATDIQELGDFDFAGNLSKFDKREVFDQLRRDDTTADEARLVHYNRVPSKAGTADGLNLHWTENVLDVPQKNGYGKWNSEAGESEDDLDDAQISSGRNSKRNTSRSAFKKPQSHKISAKSNENPAWVVDSRLLTTSFGSVRHSPLDQLGSPTTGRNLSTSPFTGSVPSLRPSLRIASSNKHCPCLSPLQILEFEQFAISELGLSEDIMTENAARGIAETFLKTSAGKQKQSTVPLVVVAAGNHKTGARAIAAGRHLRNHGYRVAMTVMGLDRQEDLLDIVKQQANAYGKAAGIVLKPNELLESLKIGTVRPTFVIDALLGIHTCFDDLRRDDQAFFFELVIWVNRGMIHVLSIDVPSGLDPSNGEVTLVDDEPLAFVPHYIISLGAPKPWLLATLGDGEKPGSTQFFLADIGISNIAWKRLGSRRNRGIDYGNEWLVRLRYQGAVD